MNRIALWCLAGLSVVNFSIAAEHEYEFRERLGAADYEAGVAELPAEKINPARARESKQPLWGVRVKSVEAGSQAEKQGLGVGWVVDRFNGGEYWNHKQGMGRVPRNAPRTVGAVSPDGERREFLFEPGKLGITTENAHQAGLYLIQNAPEGAWDRELLIAEAAWRDGRQDVSETALRRAVDKGMPASRFSRYFGALLAADAGEEELSLRMLDALVEEVSEDGEIPRFFRPGVRTLALAHGKLDLLRENLKELEGFREELNVRNLAMWETWRAGADWPGRLPDQARENAGKNLMPGIVTVEDRWKEFFEEKNPEPLRDGRYLGVTTPPGYEHFVFRSPEPVRNGIFEIRGAYGHVAEAGRFREITFQLIDLDKRAKAAEARVWNQALWIVAGIRIRREHGYDQICHLSGGPSFDEIPVQRYFPRMTDAQARRVRGAGDAGGKIELPPESVFKVSLVKNGGSIEVAVNDVSYLRLPVAPDVGELGCVVHSTGVVLAIEEMTWRPLPAD